MKMMKRFLTRFGYEKKDEKGDFLAGEGPSPNFTIEDSERGRVKLKDLEWYFWNYGPLFRGLNLKAASIWGKGFTIKHSDKKIIDLCMESTLNVPGFKQWVINESLHAFIYGKGPGEIIWNDVNKEDKDGNFIVDKDKFIVKKEEGNKIIGYNITDPKTFIPKWDKQGYITYWIQKIQTQLGDSEEMKHKSRKICHFRFHQIADNTVGIGLIESNISTIKALLIAQKSTRDLLYRHGIPFVHVTKENASAKDVKKLKKIGQNFNNSTSLASSEKIKIILIGVQGKSVEVKPHMDLLEGNLAGGLGIPKAILFFAGESVNRATLTELMTMTSIEVKTYQEKLSDIIENQILKPLLEANGKDTSSFELPQVKWNGLDEKNELEILTNFKLFSESMAKLVQVGVFDVDDVKKITKEKFDL